MKKWLRKNLLFYSIGKQIHCINVREYPRGNNKWTIQRNWQNRAHKAYCVLFVLCFKHKQYTICVGHHYAQTNTNNVNETWSLLQTTGGKGKDELSIVFMRKSQRTSECKDTYILCELQLKRNALILNKIVQHTLRITIVNK